MFGEELPAVSVPLPLVRSNTGWKRGELLERGVAPRDRVVIDAAERQHEVLEEAVVLSLDRALMA